LYKEDFNKFIKALNEAVDYVKTDLMPDFDFDAYNHEYADNAPSADGTAVVEVELEADDIPAAASNNTEEVDKW